MVERNNQMPRWWQVGSWEPGAGEGSGREKEACAGGLQSWEVTPYAGNDAGDVAGCRRVQQR